MQKSLIRFAMSAAVAVMLIPTTGCPFLFPGGGNNNRNDNSSANTNENSGGNTNANGSDNTNENSGGGGGTFTAVRTNIPMHVQGRIAAGDDLIVYGNGGFFGVDYIIPSANPTTGAGLPNGNMFQAGSFGVCGKKIALVNNFMVTIYDTVADTTNTIPVTDIRLATVPIGLSAGGHLQCDGDYVATRNDDGEVTDGKVVKVIDVSGATPAVISFDVNPMNNAAEQVAVDAETRSVIATSNDVFYVYDIDNPMTAPVMFDVSGMGGIGDTQIAYDDGVLFYMTADIPEEVYMLDVTDAANMPEIIDIASRGAALEVAYRNGAYGFFTDDESNGSLFQSVIGAMGSTTFATPDVFIDGSTTNNGVIGFGQTIQVSESGAYWLAGSESVGSGEYLMVSTGGAFAILEDPNGEDEYGCPATDVRVSPNVVAFKTGNNSDTTVGYVILGN